MFSYIHEINGRVIRICLLHRLSETGYEQLDLKEVIDMAFTENSDS